MRFLETFNRILVGMLLSLVFLQAGLLFFMKNMEDQAQFRLVKNTSTVEAQCGVDQFKDSSYWDVFSQQPLTYSGCEDSSCNNTHLHWQQEAQEKELHIISVQSAPPFRWGQVGQGGVINLRVKAQSKPQVLALVSRQRLEWNFQVDKNAKIEKVIVATPQTVWMQGLPEDVVIEYLPKEKMCSYPISWQESMNPENEFRVLLSTLKKMTGLEVNTFQGAVVGKDFRLPLFDQERQLASVPAEKKAPSLRKTGVSWGREEGRAVIESLEWKDQQIILPEKTQQVVKTTNQLLIVQNFLLWRWSEEKQKFLRAYAPLSMPEIQDIKSVAWDEKNDRLFVYNDNRGGELYEMKLEGDRWKLLQSGYSYDIQSISFDSKNQKLFAVSARSQYMSYFLDFSEDWKVSQVHELKNKISFDRRHWLFEMHPSEDKYVLSFHNAANPQGESVVLDF